MSYNQADTAALLSSLSRGDTGSLERLLRLGGAPRSSVVASAATLAVNPTDHEGRVIQLSRAAGVTATLPAATGSLNRYLFMVATTVSSNNDIIKVANANDTMVGVLTSATTTTGAGTHEAAGGTDDTITLNGTTTGGIAGSFIELTDIAANLWLVRGELVGSGSLATPLSATV